MRSYCRWKPYRLLSIGLTRKPTLKIACFAAATVVFVEPLRCERERAALRNAVGGRRFERLMGLLTFARAAITGRQIHPDLGL